MVAKNLGVGRHDNAAILGEQAVVIVVTVSVALCAGAAVDITYVTATEYVSVSFADTFRTTNLTAVDINLGCTEYISVGVKVLTYAPQVIITLSTSEYIVQNLAAEHLDVSLTGLLDGDCRVIFGAVTYGCDLTAAIQAVADNTSQHKYVGAVHITGLLVTAAEYVTTVQKVGVGNKVTLIILVGFILNLGNIIAVGILITDAAVVHSQVGHTVNGTALTTGVSVTLYSGHTLVET